MALLYLLSCAACGWVLVENKSKKTMAICGLVIILSTIGMYSSLS